MTIRLCSYNPAGDARYRLIERQTQTTCRLMAEGFAALHKTMRQIAHQQFV